MCSDVCYLAPELVLGGLDKNDDSSLVWSIGVLIVNMLLGERIFDSSSSREIIRNILNFSGVIDEGYLSKSDILDKLKLLASEKLLDIVRQCLNREPHKRMSSVELYFHPYFNDCKRSVYKYDTLPVSRYLSLMQEEDCDVSNEEELLEPHEIYYFWKKLGNSVEGSLKGDHVIQHAIMRLPQVGIK